MTATIAGVNVQRDPPAPSATSSAAASARPAAVTHYENFPVASLLLPRRLRGAVTDIYRFARAADDIADEGSATDEERLSQLGAFRAELHRIGAEPGTTPQPGSPELAGIFKPLAATIARHQLPAGPTHVFVDQVVRVKRPGLRGESALGRRCV